MAAPHQQGVGLAERGIQLSSWMLGSAVSSNTPNDFHPSPANGLPV